MKPIDFAWGSLRTITQLQPTEVKLLVDEIEYPLLERDSVGYVVHLSAPQKHRENLLKLHGMYFDNDLKGRISLWRMFKASVYHLSLHTITTDYSMYKSISESVSSVQNLMFAISQVEDFAVKGHMKSKWKGLLFDTAYANFLSFRRFRNLEQSDTSTRIAANLLGYMMVGKQIFSLGREIDEQLKSLHRSLQEVEYAAYADHSIPSSQKHVSKDGNQSRSSFQLRISTAKKIVEFLDDQGCEITSIPSPPYADNHGSNEIFDNATEAVKGNLDDFDLILRNDASSVLPGMTIEEIRGAEKFTEGEAQAVLGDWEYSLISMNKLIEIYKSLDPKSHFEGFLFP